MALRSVFIGLVFFAAGCAGTNQPPVAPDPGLPAWDGNQIVCNKTVSFAPGATDPLPDFPPEERLGFCARAMRYIALNRQYGEQTSYFGVAAASTASLAATYAPLVRRAYSASTWEFLDNLNGDLEILVQDAAAALATSGGFFSRLSGRQPDTESLIVAEQTAVQEALDALATDNPEAYTLLMQEVNATLNPTNRLLIAAMNRNPFFKAYSDGLAQLRQRHGGALDYADMAQRIEISHVLQALIEGIPPA
jgi:hypothetical protein